MRVWTTLFFLLAAGATGGLYFSAPSDKANEIDTGLPAAVTFTIDASRSRFMVKAHRGGLFWFKGHDHHIAVRDFSGRAAVDPTAINPASLEMTVRAASLEETSDTFTPQQKGIINKELNEIVLETAKYPEIEFRSTAVRGEIKNGNIEAKIDGYLNLHGVTRPITIPATVTLRGGEMHAVGEFSIDRSDFNVKATSAFHGLVRVRNGLTFTFDIVGR